jgi:hypothetical protein
VWTLITLVPDDHHFANRLLPKLLATSIRDAMDGDDADGNIQPTNNFGRDSIADMITESHTRHSREDGEKKIAISTTLSPCAHSYTANQTMPSNDGEGKNKRFTSSSHPILSPGSQKTKNKGPERRASPQSSVP